MNSRFSWGLGLLALGAALSSPALSMEVDPAVPRDQALSIQNDQDYLSGLRLSGSEVESETARLLGVPGALSPERLREWLNNRVDLVISENQPLEEAVFMAPGKAVYPESDVFPASGAPRSASAPASPSIPTAEPASSEVSTPIRVMSNVGAALYLIGKKNKALLAFQKSDGRVLPIVSPHHGLIQIGAGLFHEQLRVNAEAQDHPANSVDRIATFFHEARHSDGHGSTLGFLHAICPEGHAYAGYPACDESKNGPYTVGAQILKTLTAACADCSEKEKIALQMLEADSRSRVLAGAKDWSDDFEILTSYEAERSKEGASE